MELVYLWVEKYKNIKEQGFNFSPRFECEYDGEELTITPKEHIKNFFDEKGKVNITAIVGENGSGKSSIIKLIFLLIFIKKYNFKNNPLLHESIVEAIRLFTTKELFLIINIGSSTNPKYNKISIFYFINQLVSDYPNSKDIIIGNNGIIPNCKIEYEELEQNKIDFFNIHFNYMLDTLYDGVQDKWIKEIYHKADSYETPLLLEPYKNNNKRQLIDLDIIEYLNQQNMLRFYAKFDNNKKIFDFFKPNKVNINFKIKNFNWLNLDDEEFKCLSKCKYFIAYKFFKLYEDNNIFLSLRGNQKEICKICRKIDKLYINSKYKCINKIYILLKVLESKKELFEQEEYKKINDWAIKIDNNKSFFELPKIIYSKLILKKSPNYEVRKIQNCISFENKVIYNNRSFIDTIENIGLVDITQVKDIFISIPPWVSIGFYENEKSINSLSSGEKSFFTFIINLMYQVQNLNDLNEYKTINLFLDETELGLHPNWQKRYLKNILFALKQVTIKQINLIFATHSPFLISDLPKENVIFLDTDKEGNCKNVTSTIKINPFGANIHTLLSDGFFMEGGLMGEFAKGKINKIIRFLNGKNTFIDFPIEEIEKVINTIGEAFLKEKLLKIYDNKFPKTKNEKIEELQKQIDELKNA